jgi:hypothetical protein
MPVKSGLTFFLLIFYTTTIVWGMDKGMFTQESLLQFLTSVLK